MMEYYSVQNGMTKHFYLQGNLFRKKDDPQESMFIASGDKWKRLRSVASPSFTTGRMKQVVSVIYSPHISYQ